MAEHVCPWWLGYLLASPIRRWFTQSPEKMLEPFVPEGSVVLEPGPGMGFFTLPLARMVGSTGRVVAVDIQPKMLEVLKRKATREKLSPRIETRLASSERMGLEDLKGTVDFCLGFAVVHEMSSEKAFFQEVAQALKPGGLLFLAEPTGHVKPDRFAAELKTARDAGLEVLNRPTVSRCQAAVLKKVAA